MLGISVYAGMENSLNENIEYINEARKMGLNTMFTSLHIPETHSKFEEEAIEILTEANRLNMRIIADISKKYYEKLDINKYNIYSLRLDFGFSNKDIAELTRNKDFNITLNASTLDRDDIEDILKYGGNLEKIIACHNYYPKKDTGISEDLFNQRNQLFKEYGLEIIAFISSRNIKRGPIYEGLPTLEKHRNIDPVISAQHLLRLGVDTVLIGDSRASKDELIKLSNINKDILIIPIKPYLNMSSEEKQIIEQVHTNRKDPGEFIIRSQEARHYKKGTIIPNNTIERFKYCVTIDNENYLRYEGDLQIAKKELCKDSRVNVIADASEASVLIDILKPGDKFKLEVTGG
ncbi:MupG family TIM beta-alpha barrel fold protein [Brassicibacter mesophilus]|uniref:MupG family TIM beta-alpha barrel fold protein n=1 Tax=Brassicibacter mesophilus TaxID=745119 RepID=UPI003D1F5200